MSQSPRKLTRTERALKKVCPKCGAVKGEQCTRAQPSFLAQERQHYTPAALANLAKMGQPLDRPHNERFNELPDNAQARWVKAQDRAARALARTHAKRTKLAGIQSAAWTPDLHRQRQIRALQVHQAAERRFARWEMLVRFFAHHGDIFKEPTR